ncbi:MAG: extracellular solute-binding protein [Rhodoglobus sp.]|nr:extracellular solute-binding protein [Rhodoglobus sp.]
MIIKNLNLKNPTHRSRWIAAIAAVAAAPLLLAGCTADAAPDLPAGEVGGKLTYWFAMESTDDESVAQMRETYVDPFEALYPNVTVDLIPQADEGATAKVQTALAAGQGPDFIETAGSATAIPFAEAGYLADLGPLAEKEGWKDTMFPWAMDMGVIDGKLVAMPVTYETLVLYYNKTLFDEHGWEVPTDRASLESLAEEMEDAGVTPFTAGNADYFGATEWQLSAYLNQVAGPGAIHDALAGELPFTDDVFVDSVQMMVDDFQNGWYGGGVKQYFSTTDPQKYAKFANGDAGMFISGSWELFALNEYFGESDSDWSWAPLPPMASGVPSDVYPLSVGGTMSINAASKNIPAAEAYVKWMFSDIDARWNAIETIGDLPLPVAFDPADVPEGIDPRFTEQYTAISDASLAENVGYVTWTSFGGAQEAYILENVDRLLTGDLSAKDFCKALNEAYQKDAAAGVIPPLFDTSAR